MTSWSRSMTPLVGGPVLGAMRTPLFQSSRSHWPRWRRMRSMICASLMSDTMIIDTGRISCWRWDVIGTQQRIDFPDLLDQLAPRSRRDALGLSARCSMISIAALANALHFCAAVAADSFGIFSFARFLRCPRILLEYQP